MPPPTLCAAVAGPGAGGRALIADGRPLLPAATGRGRVAYDGALTRAKALAKTDHLKAALESFLDALPQIKESLTKASK